MGYNPLSCIERYTDQSYPYNTQDIEMLAEYLCPIECDKDPFWDYSARMFMATLIAYVMEALPENEKAPWLRGRDSGIYGKIHVQIADNRMG